MSDVGTDWGSLDSDEEEFLKAVRKQSIGRPCVVRPSKNLVSKFTNQISPPSFSFPIYLVRNLRVEDNKHHSRPH